MRPLPPAAVLVLLTLPAPAQSAGINPVGGWYRDIGGGMGAALNAAAAMDAYISGARAEDAPEWNRVKLCFDTNLKTFMASNKPANTVFRATRTICDSEVIDAEKLTFRLIASEGQFTKPVDSAMLALAI